jgi:hypothetical protein
MWPFFANNDAEKAGSNSESTRKPMAFTEIVAGMGDYSDLGVHDVALKFWLPEPAEKALAELAELNGMSMSESLRQFFVLHCYGLYAFTIMTNAIPRLFRDGERAKFSKKDTEDDPPNSKRITTYWVPELGKNVAPVKLWIPQRLRKDLQVLADHVGIKLSQYLREIVISRLLGHGTLPKRPEILVAAPSPAADAWCEDEQVPWREVDYERYSAALIRQHRGQLIENPADSASEISRDVD